MSLTIIPACIILFMRFKLLSASRLLVFLFLFLPSCSPTPQPPLQTTFYVYRFDPSAFIEFSSDFQPIHEIPFTVPPNCTLFEVFPAPSGPFMLIELSCPNGQTVLFLDTSSSLSASSASITQPVTDSDSHFLAWTSDGESVYLKVDTLGDARVIRVSTSGRHDDMDITGWTYDLAAKPDSSDFIFTFSGGLGSGSEMTLARHEGRDLQQLYVDQFNYVSFAHYSPDGRQIAFIKIPDSQIPFTVGELWVMDMDGSNPRKLADADAGHGYAANWSADGKWIAFVKRENPDDESANQSADSLMSNIHLVKVQSGELTQITRFMDGYVETPYWSPDGNTLAFNVVVDGRIEVQTADIASGEIRSLITESTCCPAWMRK
jgi:dipeptidyl aminopeptidase/acylaminoacyl peptidase